jgi:hypothetical protein
LPANVVTSSAQLSDGGGVAFNNTNNVTFGSITASLGLFGTSSYAITASYAMNAGGGGGGGIGGSGTITYIPKFSGTTTLADSLISDDGTSVSIAGNLTATSFTGSLLGTASYSAITNDLTVVAKSEVLALFIAYPNRMI